MSHRNSQKINSNKFQSVLHIGVCMPSACNDLDSYTIGKDLLRQDKFPDIPMLNELAIISTKVLQIRNDFMNETFVILML